MHQLLNACIVAFWNGKTYIGEHVNGYRTSGKMLKPQHQALLPHAVTKLLKMSMSTGCFTNNVDTI